MARLYFESMARQEMPEKGDNEGKKLVNAESHLKQLRDITLRFRQTLSQEEMLDIVNCLVDKTFTVPSEKNPIKICEEKVGIYSLSAAAFSASYAPYGPGLSIALQSTVGLLHPFKLPLYLECLETKERFKLKSGSTGNFKVLNLVEGLTYQIKLDE